MQAMSKRLSPLSSAGGIYATAVALALLLVAMLSPVPASAQKATLIGTVRDTAGAPVGSADVAIASERVLTRTDSAGVFRITGLPAREIELSVRRLGYEPQSMNLTPTAGLNDTVRVVMQMRPEMLPGMTVSERDMHRRIAIEEFYRRRVRGQGSYVTREDIETRHAMRLSDALAGVPGLSLSRQSVHGGMAIRFLNSSVVRRDCVPEYWLDGVRAQNVSIDDFPPSDIEGIELYRGASTTPAQFWQGNSQTAFCGTIVVWSRVPGA